MTKGHSSPLLQWPAACHWGMAPSRSAGTLEGSAQGPTFAGRPDRRGSTVGGPPGPPGPPRCLLAERSARAWRGSLGPAALSTAVCRPPEFPGPRRAASPQEASGPRPPESGVSLGLQVLPSGSMAPPRFSVHYNPHQPQPITPAPWQELDLELRLSCHCGVFCLLETSLTLWKCSPNEAQEPS